jgi:hypothetical protein
MNKPIIIPIAKPRNPLVAQAHFRKAGSHATRKDRLERAMKRDRRSFYAD